MSSPITDDINEINEENHLNENDETKKSEDTIPLPPAIPLNYRRKNRDHIPKIDSAVLFQSNGLLSTNAELKPMPSLTNTNSSQIPLLSFSNDSGLFKTNGSIEQFNTKLLAAKQTDFPPILPIKTYFNDLFRREIKAPHFQKVEDLLNFVEPNSIENYASKNFRNTGFLFFNKQNIQELTTFSDKPLQKPLLEKIPLSKKAIVEKLSVYILSYIDVFHDEKIEEQFKRLGEDKKEGITFSIILILHDDDSLIDECVMQLIKLMRESPSPETLHLTWKLFLIILTIFYIGDPDVVKVIQWFLMHRIFEKDLEGKYARFAFIRFYERLVIGRNFDISMPKNEIIRIPLGVQLGRKMFKCSLYLQMWNQKRRFPKLQIPLTVYLVVKALIKNGVLMTPRPFPDFGLKTSNSKSLNFNNDSNERNNFIVNEDFNVDNEEEKKAPKEEENIKMNANDDANKSKWKNENCCRKADMKIVKSWAAKLNGKYDVINDGEVCNLLGLLLTWMLNLLDPIVPKSMAEYFIETFSKDESDPSWNDKYEKFVNDLPLLHLNTLKYLIGFFREIAQNNKFTLETHLSIAENLGNYFVRTSFVTIDPFTRQKMTDFSPRFLLYCLDNLDVSNVYPLNPASEVQKDV